jgi:hypothetical protein
MHDVLKATALIGRAPPEVYALVAGHGEIWSARLLAAALSARGVTADWFDAREALTVITAASWARPSPGNGLGALHRRVDAAAGRAGDHRLHRARRARRADHPGAKRQRLLGLDLRRAARRRGGGHLDRRRRRDERRSAPHPGRLRDPRAVLARGDGTGLFRRQGAAPAHHGAAGGAQHPGVDPQYGPARRPPARASARLAATAASRASRPSPGWRC